MGSLRKIQSEIKLEIGKLPSLTLHTTKGLISKICKDLKKLDINIPYNPIKDGVQS